MISNQILQNTIDGLKSITRRELSVIDRNGKIIVTTEKNLNSESIEGVTPFINSPAENQLIKGYQYFKVFDNGSAEYILIIKGDDEDTYQIGKIASFQLKGLLIAYKERYDKDNFIKNLLLDNLLLIDIYSRAKKLHIENKVKRIVYLIEAKLDSEFTPVDIIRNIFPSKSKNFVAAVDEKSIILVKELAENEDKEEIERFAEEIFEKLTNNQVEDVFIAIGSIVYDLKNISTSFKEARMSLDIGKIFYNDKKIINYDQLGIGRLIYQLPDNLCKMFVTEVLQDTKPEQFDEETLTTVSKFFENNLNVSETSRQLYIHRNTLVYRLDKLQKMTGLDLRNFDDAIVFKIMFMVSKYMSYKESNK